MKKFTFMLIALLAVVMASAQKSDRVFKPIAPIELRQTQIQANGIARTHTATAQKAPRRASGLVTPPEGAVSETYYTASGKCYVYTSSGWQDATSVMPSIEIIVDGKDIYVAGLSYWANDAWIKGTISGTTASFPSGQQVDDDEEFPEWILGSNDGSTVSETIDFEFDQKNGIFESTTKYIGGAASETTFSLYEYWSTPTFTKEEPVAPEVVVAPKDLVTEDYILTYEDYYGEAALAPVSVGFDGNDVYFQGLNSYLPEAWVKGTLEKNVVTIAGNQYFGAYSSYEMFLQEEDYQFAYDAEAGVFTGNGLLYTYTGSSYVDYYNNPVLKKVVEKVAMPANPEITKLEDSNYGWRFYFNVPIVDINGDGLLTSKLSYMIYTDIEGKIAPLTFTPATHTRLTEDMTEFPYGFTEDYDIYVNRIYLNELYSADWNNLGIKSIYRGGGEENATEIQWYHIKDYSGGDGIFNFNALTESQQPVSTSNTHDGDIPEEGQVLKSGAVTLTVSASTTSTPNRYWMAGEVIQLRVYGGTLTFEVPEGYTITAIDCNAPTWNDKNTFDPESDKIEEEAPAQHYLWAGSAEKVTLTVNGKTFFNSIVVTVEGGDEPGPEEEAIDPEGKTYTFDDSDMEGWTTIDADGDGYNWVLGSAVGGIYLTAGSSLAGNGHGSSADFVVSGSYSNVTGALKPDNYFVSPKVKLGSTFSFFAAAQDAGYPEEHFGVFVSTKGKNVGDFEKMDEWTLTKVRAEKVSASVSEAFGSSTKGQGRWYQYIVDMSSYKGQEGYVAIRHFDCTDQFLMLVDDITFGTPADPDPEPENNLVELPEGVEAESWTIEGVYYSSYASDKQFATGVAFDGNDIYVQGLAYYFPEAWVKGTIADGIATFPTGQFVGEDEEYGEEYIIGVDEKYAISDFQYAYDAKAKTLTQLTPFIVENDGVTDEIDPWGYWLYSYLYEGEPVALNPVEAPESLETESYFFKALMSVETEDEDGETVYEEEEYTSDVLVGFDGDDVYIQGLAGDYPEGWVKATKNEAGQYVIPANQYMGTLEYFIYEFMYYFAALNEDLEPEDVVLTFDEATNTFSTDQIVMLNGSRFIVYPYLTYEEVDITKIVEMAGTPADPSFTDYTLEGTNYPNVNFNIPIIDTDGNPLLPSKFFYTVWVEKDGQQMPYTVLADEYKYVEEDMVEIPYSYDDGYDIYKGGKTFYFNPVDEVAEFTNIGVQSIYYGGNECNKTDIIWLDGTVTTGIKDINTANNTAVYYDLQGRKVTASQKGLLIKQSRQDNGTITTVKVVRK